MKRKKVTVSRLIEFFLEHGAKQKGWEPGTHDGYADRLKRLNGEYGATKATKVDRRELLSFIHSSEQGLSDATRRQTITVIEQLQRYGLKFGFLKQLWIQPGDVKKPPQGRREDIPTHEQATAICREMRPFARPIYRTLRLTGARPGELCRANIEDLKGEPDARVIVLAKHKTAKKTGMSRRILLSPSAEAIVMEQIAGRESGPIFRTSRGNRWIRDRLSREFRRCRNKLKFPVTLVLYSARHEAASIMIDETGDIHKVAMQLGHRNISTTQRYLHPKESKIRQAASVIPDVETA